MQKIVQEHYANPTDSTVFHYETISADLDEEVLFKRIRLSIAAIGEDNTTLGTPMALRWAFIQADTGITPTASDMSDDNRVVCGGVLPLIFGSGLAEYDRTITMRKLKSSSIYLCLQLLIPTGASSMDVNVYSYVQCHYLEM